MSVITAAAGTNAWNTNGAWIGGVQPTAADDVVIPTGSTVNLPNGVTNLCRSLQVTGTGALTSANSLTCRIDVGDASTGISNIAFSVDATASLPATNWTLNFVSTSATQQTVTSNGKSFSALTYNGAGGSWINTDAMICTNNWTLTAGSVDTAGYTITAVLFSSTNSNVRSLTTGSSTFMATSTGAVTVLSFSTLTNLTLSAANATLALVNSASPRTVNIPAPLIWGTVDYSNNGSTGALTFNSTGAIETLKFSDASNVRTLSLASNPTINNWQVFGTASFNMSIISSVGGTARTITVNGLTVQTVNYITFQDIRIAQPYKLFATNSTNTSNNLNVNFNAPPSTPLLRQDSPVPSVVGATSATATFTYPTVAGNLLLLILGVNSLLGTITDPVGWTQANISTNTSQSIIWYKVADGTETTVTPSWTNTRSAYIKAYEIYNWSGAVPTLDTVTTSTSASANTLTTGSATNSTAPAISIVGFGGAGTMGVSTTAPTNNFQEDYSSGVQASGTFLKLGLLPLTSSAAQSTTFTWTTARVPVSTLTNFVGVTPAAATDGNFLMFM